MDINVNDEISQNYLHESISKQLAVDQYNEGADKYIQSKYFPWRKYCEKHTINSLIDMLGGVNGKRVIDYSRWLRSEKNAAEVLGIDISSSMIEHAQKIENIHPLNIKYECKDATLLSGLNFDIVFSAWLLNYAASYNELVLFIKSIYNLLPENGIFVGFINSPHDNVCHHPELLKYGFLKTWDDIDNNAATINTCKSSDNENRKIAYTFYLNDNEILKINNYFLSRNTYDLAFRNAGFKNFGYVSLNISTEGKKIYGDEYWHDLLSSNFAEGVFAIK